MIFADDLQVLSRGPSMGFSLRLAFEMVALWWLFFRLYLLFIWHENYSAHSVSFNAKPVIISAVFSSFFACSALINYHSFLFL